MADIKIAGRIKAGAADGISGYASEILFDDAASNKTVKEKIEEAASSPQTMIVTISPDGNDGYEADKTFAEIKAFIDNGGTVIAKDEEDGDSYYYLDNYIASEVVFTRNIWGSGGFSTRYYTIDNTNTVSFIDSVHHISSAVNSSSTANLANSAAVKEVKDDLANYVKKDTGDESVVYFRNHNGKISISGDGFIEIDPNEQGDVQGNGNVVIYGDVVIPESATVGGKSVAVVDDIPDELADLAGDSTHRTVTDAEKSTWNGKQNALTFDNVPTANSNNPVKSSGIKTALDAKQSTISTVNVTVDNNTGTPSGSASVSGSTLSLSFQNLKGATGATGATGPQGPQGERGLPGESGVTGDVSGFTVIQTIDPSATYGATDIAGAATVQATNQELTELEGEVNVAKNELVKILKNTSFDSFKLFQNVISGQIFNANGYITNAKYATCKINLTAGNYIIPALTDGYQWALYRYISDSQGEVIFNFRAQQTTTALDDGDYVFVFRNLPTGGTISTWNDTHTAYVNNIEVGIENSSSLEGKLDDEISRSQAVDLTLQQDIVKETQRAKNEEEKTDYKASLIGSDIFGQQEISKNLVPYQLYGTEGYSEGGNNARTRIFPAGVYNISSLEGTDYRYSIFTYIDDTNGEQIYAWKNGALMFKAVSPFIINYINQGVTTLTEEQIDYIDKNHSIVLISDFNLNLSVSNGNRPYSYFSYIITEKSYDVTFKSSNNSEINYLGVYAYDGSTNIGLLAEINIGETKTITIPANATRIVFSNLVNVTSDTLLEVNVIESDTTKATIQSLERSVGALESSVDALNAAVFNPETDVSFCDNVSSDVLVEMYFPNITSDWKIIGVDASYNLFRLNLKDSEGVSHYYGEGGTADAQKLQGKYSDTIQTWVDDETSSIIGYFILHYTGTNYAVSNNNGFNINISAVTNIDNSPRIKEYLSRKENIVLLGDSLFGYGLQNLLHGFLINKTDNLVANAGFSGCRAAWRTSDGSNNWDKMSFVNIADAIASNDFSTVESAIDGIGSSYSYFRKRLASLKAIDFTKPTTVFVNYGNNDITGGNAIGDLWDKSKILTDYDKTTYIGAINYGIVKLSQAFPNIKVIVFNQGWRMIGGTVKPDGGTSGDTVAPYEYINSAGITFYQYLAAIKENCERCGVRLYDFFRMGGRCAFNWDYYSVDSSHFNVKGYEMLANIIAAQVKELAG